MTKKIILAFAAILLFQSIALAQTADEPEEGFTILPTYRNAIDVRTIIHEMKPGDTVEDFITVKNYSSSGKSFNIYAADLYYDDKGTLLYKAQNDAQESIGEWITVDEPIVSLKSKEEKTIKITISIPENTPLSEYRGGIALENVVPSESYEQIKIASRIMMNVRIKVTDSPKPVPKLGQTNIFSSATPYFWTSLAIFGGSIIYFVWANRKEKKSAQNK